MHENRTVIELLLEHASIEQTVTCAHLPPFQHIQGLELVDCTNLLRARADSI